MIIMACTAFCVRLTGKILYSNDSSSHKHVRTIGPGKSILLAFYFITRRRERVQLFIAAVPKKKLQLALHLQTAADIVVVGSNNVAEPAAPLLALLKRASRSQGVARPLVPRRRRRLLG